MKIRQWLGFNEDASQYLLRPGELRILNNLQSRRPGMLLARKGLTKIYGQWDNEAIHGLYRRATVFGNPSDFLWLQKAEVDRELTIAQVANQEFPKKFVWNVRRIEGNQSRIIDTVDIAPNGTDIHNFSVSEDRHGRMFIFYGHGVRPRLYRPTNIANVALPMGLDAPTSAPSVTPSGTGYFIETVDVQSGGGAYSEPPEITLSGGTPDRPAKLKAIVQAGNVVGVDIVDGGANYKSTPTLTVSSSKIGTGFRAKGNISNSARTIEGFSETDAATVTGTAAGADDTYGTTNGTDGNSIMYLSQPRAVTEKITNVSGDVLTLNSVAGIQVGDTVTVYPAAAPFNASPAVTVVSVNTTNSTVTISNNTFSPVSGTAYDATFRRAAVVSTAVAEYDSARRRFYATISLASSSTTGRDAQATLEFTPKPLGFGLNTVASSSITVTANNFQTYKTEASKNKASQYLPYLYGEYWEGSDYDVKGTVQNARYGGLQASGSRYVRGFSGTVNGKRADVYWPDYSKISVWFNTGTASGNNSQWQRADVEVTQEAIPGTSPTAYAKVLQFQLRPTQQAKTIKSLGGATISTTYEPYSTLPDAVAPTVKMYLQECPDKWVASGDQCLPTSVKEAETNRLPWWTDGTLVSRPIVGITPADQAITADAVTIVNPGSGWQKDTQFKFRLYQANAYDQFVDYNTAVVEDSIQKAHAPYEENNRYVEFTLTANTPDELTPHGPPNFLVTPAQVTIPGNGYTSGQSGSITLYKRGVNDAVSAATQSVKLSWTAKVLDTLSPTSTGSIASITILSKGRNYLSSPTVEVRGGGQGYGLSVQPTVVDGRIDSVQIIDPGTGYTTSPELFTSTRAAELTPVMRPAMRGKYRCAYRYVDLSETVVATVTGVLGDSATTLTLSSAEGVKPDMILDSPSLPHYARVKSVNGNQVEINQQITGLAPATSITIKVRDLTKPISYSDLSPITDVDAGPNDTRTHSSIMTWSLPGAAPPARADKVELWRTSGDQSLVFYRVEAYGVPTQNGIQIVGSDTLTDEELFDPDRAHYAALPVVLPNGGLNAYRFGTPRTDMSVAVAFQDRLWMGVSTSGNDANTLYYSEFDEFESTPDTNELPIQINTKSTDVLTALVPFGSMLLAMQNSHTYAIQYNTDPGVDASIQMLSHRGCLHQRCWDIHENILYAADESGIYALERNGKVTDISLPLRDYFVSEVIDFTKRETFFLQADPRTHILRFFCVLKSNQTDTPAIALCYDIQAQTWWTESYPNSLNAATTGRPGVTRINTILLGGVDGHLYEIAPDSDHANDTLTDTFVTEGGSGYREAPVITVPNCEGAVVQGVVSEGRLVDVVIQNSGWETRWGIGLLAENGTPLAVHDGRPLQGVEYTPIKLDVGPPDPGGVQAVAYANFSITPRVVRTSTVAVGESFVRLEPPRLAAFEPDSTAIISSELGLWLTTEADEPIRTEPVPVEVGMEAVGPYIPMNSFVSHLDGRDVYLKHPDGTPVSMLGGKPRNDITQPIYPVRVMFASGAFYYGAYGTVAVGNPSAGWGGSSQDLHVLGTITAPGQTLSINLLYAMEAYEASNPAATPANRNFQALEVVLVDAANRVVGWANTISDPLLQPAHNIPSTNGTGGYYMTVEPMQFPLVTYPSWAISTNANDFPAPGSALEAIVPLTPLKDLTGLVPSIFPTVSPRVLYGGTDMIVNFYKPYRTHIPFRMATGFMQLLNEENAKNGDALADRSVSLVYTPTPGDKDVEVIERFNGRDEMRPNVMRRSRGGPGTFVHRQDSASTVLNMSKTASHLGFATGVATAKFASQATATLTGTDQHLQVELYARPNQASPWVRTNFWNADRTIRTPYPFVMHSLSINGVVEDGQ